MNCRLEVGNCSVELYICFGSGNDLFHCLLQGDECIVALFVNGCSGCVDSLLQLAELGLSGLVCEQLLGFGQGAGDYFA